MALCEHGNVLVGEQLGHNFNQNKTHILMLLLGCNQEVLVALGMLEHIPALAEHGGRKIMVHGMFSPFMK